VGQFRYLAVDPQGVRFRGETEADTASALADLLAQRGFRLLRAQGVRSRGEAREVRVPRREVIDFLLNLATLENAGIPLHQGLDDLAEECTGARIGKILASLRDDVGRGRALSDALGDHGPVFPPLVVEAVRAGEKSGSLAEVLTRLGRYLEWREGLRRKVRQMLAYPLVITGAVVGLILLLLTFLLPRLLGVYESAGASLPLPTRILLATSRGLTEYGHLVALGAGAIAGLFLLVRRSERGRLVLARSALRLPALGPVLRMVSSAQFASTLGTLHRAGVDLPSALERTAGSVENRFLSRAVSRAGERILAGMPLSEAVRADGVFPRLVPRLLSVGEKSGNLDDALRRLAETYDREVSAAVARFLAAIEPILTLVLGAIVGLVVLATLLPVFRLLEVIRR